MEQENNIRREEAQKITYIGEKEPLTSLLKGATQTGPGLGWPAVGNGIHGSGNERNQGWGPYSGTGVGGLGCMEA